jgi:hypothetical protein
MAAKGTVGQLLVSIRGDLSGLRFDIQEMQNQFKSSFTNIQSQAVSLGRNLASAFGVGLSVGALVAFGRSVVDLASRLSDLSKQTGIAASQLMALKPIAENNGASVEEFANSITRLQIQIGQIKDKSDPAYKALQELGINFDEIANASPEQSFKILADALDQVTDSAQRDALAFVFFGRSWVQIKAAMPEIITILGQTDEALDKQIAELDKYQDKWNTTWNNLIQYTTFGAGYIIEKLEEITKKLTETKLGDLAKTMMGMAPTGGWQASAGHFAEGGFRVNPETGDFGPSSQTEVPPHRTLTDKTAEDKIKTFLETLQKQLAALEAEKIGLTEGAAAAEKWKVEHEAMAVLGTTKLPPAVQKVIDLLVAEKGAIEQLKQRQDALKEGAEQLVKQLKDVADQANKFSQLSFEARKSGLDDMNAALEDSKKKWNELRLQITNTWDLLSDFGPIKRALDALDLAQGREGAGIRAGSALGGVDATERQREAIIQLEHAYDDLGKTSEANQMMFKNLGLDFDELSARISVQREAVANLIERFQEMRDIGDDTTQVEDDLKKAFSDLNKSITDQKFQDLAQSIGGAIDESIMGVIQGTQTLSDAMRNMARNIALAFINEFMQTFLIKPMVSGIGMGLKALLGVVGGMAGGSTGSIPIGGGGFGSIGGPVAEMGGMIRSFASGGAVPIIAHGGEFVMSRGAVDSLGASNLAAMNSTGKMSGGGATKVTLDFQGAQIIPKAPWTTPEDVVKVGIKHLNDDGTWINVIGNRMSRK